MNGCDPGETVGGESNECQEGGGIEGETSEWDKRGDDGFELLWMWLKEGPQCEKWEAYRLIRRRRQFCEGVDGG